MEGDSMFSKLGYFSLVSVLVLNVTEAVSQEPPLRWLNIAAETREQRSEIVNLGIDIEEIRSDSVWALATEADVRELERRNYPILGNFDSSVWLKNFPEADQAFHNYAELTQELHDLQKKNADIASLMSIGKTVEGREIWAIHINTTAQAHQRRSSSKPGIIYMGNHHAREHLSLEVPLLFAKYLLENRTQPRIQYLLESRDIWIIPMVNPDGAEFDIASGSYKMWRKNRKKNSNGTYGVDLNRNYGFKWGSGGSSTNPASDIYMGPSAFSEPETQAIRNFIQARPNIKILLTYHSFSELILYPWGHSYNPVPQERDRQVFEKMGQVMSQWNGYRPQSASDLYIASGDTVDWAYGSLGIFAFTFELSPKSTWEGGFYPGAGVIERVFNANLEPNLYLLEMAVDPYRALSQK